MHDMRSTSQFPPHVASSSLRGANGALASILDLGCPVEGSTNNKQATTLSKPHQALVPSISGHFLLLRREVIRQLQVCQRCSCSRFLCIAEWKSDPFVARRLGVTAH